MLSTPNNSLLKSNRNKSLSSIKAKKSKNFAKLILDTPPNDTFSSIPVINNDNDFNDFLQRSLSLARINNEVCSEESKLARRELVLGMNAVSRNVRGCSLSAVLIATDVTPLWLIAHLRDLLLFKNVPAVRLNSLRRITSAALGFECVALGILKKSSRFQEIVERVSALWGELQTGANEEVDEEIIEIQETPKKAEVEESTRDDFIALGSEVMEFDPSLPRGISNSILKSKVKKKIVLLDDDNMEEPQPKKRKKNWQIDTTPNFTPPKIFHMTPNPLRKKNKRRE